MVEIVGQPISKEQAKKSDVEFSNINSP